jgi:hypothetical protein
MIFFKYVVYIQAVCGCMAIETIAHRRSPRGVDTMADKTNKAKHKRLSKGQRTHIRRLKQAARKAGTAYNRPPGA